MLSISSYIYILNNVSYARRSLAQVRSREKPENFLKNHENRLLFSFVSTHNTAGNTGKDRVSLFHSQCVCVCVREREMYNIRRKLFPNGLLSIGFGRGFRIKPIKTFPIRHAVIFGTFVTGAKTVSFYCVLL